jgi:hypothetical protein
MVDPERGVRCAIRNTGVAGSDRYHWTITVFGDTDPVASGLGEARSRAEQALLACPKGGEPASYGRAVIG